MSNVEAWAEWVAPVILTLANMDEETFAGGPVQDALKTIQDRMPIELLVPSTMKVLEAREKVSQVASEKNS